MANFKITEKVDGEKVSLSLTDREVLAAISVGNGNNVESVIVMKKDKGAAMSFSDPSKAAACQTRHKFDYSFEIKVADLQSHVDKSVKK